MRAHSRTPEPPKSSAEREKSDVSRMMSDAVHLPFPDSLRSSSGGHRKDDRRYLGHGVVSLAGKPHTGPVRTLRPPGAPGDPVAIDGAHTAAVLAEIEEER
jgi:hypothetical protein